jgi:hypothetical protein
MSEWLKSYTYILRGHAISSQNAQIDVENSILATENKKQMVGTVRDKWSVLSDLCSRYSTRYLVGTRGLNDLTDNIRH